MNNQTKSQKKSNPAALKILKNQIEGNTLKTLSNAVGFGNELEPLTANEIFERLNRYLPDHFFTIDATLCHECDGKLKSFSKSAELFGYLSEHMLIDWSNKQACMTKEEFLYWMVRCGAPNYVRFESIPHEPRLSDVRYGKFEQSSDVRKNYFTELLRMFNPATEKDAVLLKAAFMTPFWGGPPASRPIFILSGRDDDSDGGVGVGKSTVTETISELCGGMISERTHMKAREITQRLLATNCRVVRFDNIKGTNLSWDVLEDILTAKWITGRKLYSNDDRVPNYFTFYFTFNNASMSKDLAQRSFVINLDRPTYSVDWANQLDELLNNHRNEIISDILSQLMHLPGDVQFTNRFPQWSNGVLAKIPGCLGAITEIEKTQKDYDAETDLKELYWEAICSNVGELSRESQTGIEISNIDPETERLIIARSLIWEWINEARRTEGLAKRSAKYLAVELGRFAPPGVCLLSRILRGTRYIGLNCSKNEQWNYRVIKGQNGSNRLIRRR